MQKYSFTICSLLFIRVLRSRSSLLYFSLNHIPVAYQGVLGVQTLPLNSEGPPK